MKTKSIGKTILFVGLGVFYFFRIQCQTNTALSGTYSLSNTQSAGNGGVGADNTSVGIHAGYSLNSSSNQNTFVGGYAGANVTAGTNNTFLGSSAGYNTGNGDTYTSGLYNTFVGKVAGFQNTIGASNVYIGYYSGYSNTAGNYNTCIGPNAGRAATGSSNNFLGNQAGYNCTGSNNNFLGYSAGYNNTSGASNSIFGHNAGKYNQTGPNNSIFGNSAGYGNGSVNSYNGNSFFGYNAGYGITGGTQNVFLGYQSGYTNSAGIGNTGLGYQSLYTNSSGLYNCAMGQQALKVSTGSYNNALGKDALLVNTSGQQNCAFGSSALASNITSNNNTAIGYSTLLQTIGSSGVGGNTAIGYSAGSSNTTGTYNTYVGYLAQAGANNYTNSTAIGNGATTTNSNILYFGNASVSTIKSSTGVLTASDGRFKTNVTENVSGLAFIKKLRPVTYNLDTKSLDSYLTKNLPDSVKITHQTTIDFATSSAIVHSGFIAQEVAQAAKDCGFISSIVHTPASDNDPYAVNYAQIVVPLVKAIQEQQTIIDSLTITSNHLDSVNETLQSQIANCCNNNQLGTEINKENIEVNYNIARDNINDSVLSDSGIANNSTVATLMQNIPNPFSKQTNIQYFIPATSQSAMIMVFDFQGKLVKTIIVTNFGSGAVTINGNELNPGMFVYSLVVDGKIIDTKRMILTQ